MVGSASHVRHGPGADHPRKAGQALKPTHVKGMFGKPLFVAGTASHYSVRLTYSLSRPSAMSVIWGYCSAMSKNFFRHQRGQPFHVLKNAVGAGGTQPSRLIFRVRMGAGEAQHMAASQMRRRHAG